VFKIELIEKSGEVTSPRSGSGDGLNDDTGCGGPPPHFSD